MVGEHKIRLILPNLLYTNGLHLIAPAANRIEFLIEFYETHLYFYYGMLYFPTLTLRLAM